MTKQINIAVGQAINGGPGLGIMTSASNPWTVVDGLADELVNRKVASYVTGQPVPSQYGTPLWADAGGTQLIKPDGSPTALGSGGVSTLAALTDLGTADLPTLNTPLLNKFATKGDALAAGDIAAGAVAITRAAHLNRPLDCPGTTTGTFAATATSGAAKGDAFELNIGAAGAFTAAGAITAPTGYKLTAGPKETFTARYDAAADAFYSTTPIAGAATWGSIGGTLSAQADVVAAFVGKVDVHLKADITANTSVTVALHADRVNLVAGTGIVITIDNDAATGANAAETFFFIPTEGSTFTVVAGTAVFTSTSGTSLDSSTSVGGAVAVERIGTSKYRALSATASVASSAGTLNMAKSGYGVWSPAGLGATTFNNTGFGLPSALDSSTTVAASTADGTGNYGSLHRLGYQSAAAAVNRVAGWYGLSGFVRPTDSSDQNGRFPVIAQGGVRDAIAGGTFAMGLATGTPPDLRTVEPSTLLSCAFVGFDTTDANFQVMHNDNAGTCTKHDTGIAKAQWKLLMVRFNKNAANTSWTVDIWVRDSSTTFSVTFTTDIPTPSLQPFTARSSMGNASTVGVDSGEWFLGSLT